jgi:hypothetical protein
MKIKNALSGNIIAEYECENILECVFLAVSNNLNLSGADLYRANLSGADLSGADLPRANLSGADLDKKHRFISISPIGSENGCLWVMENSDGILIYNRGCFSGTKDGFVKAVSKKHAGTIYEKEYIAAVRFIELKLSQSHVRDG